MLERLRSKWGPVHPPSTASLQPRPATVHRAVDLLQPPPATVHRASMGSCSSTPNRLGCGGLLGVLFIQRQRPTTTGSCSSNPNGNCSSTTNQPARLTISRLVLCTVCMVAMVIVHREATQHRLATSHTGARSASVSTSSDRSLGFI